MSVRHAGHCAHCRAQFSHVFTWPHGSSTTFGASNMHTQHGRSTFAIQFRDHFSPNYSPFFGGLLNLRLNLQGAQT